MGVHPQSVIDTSIANFRQDFYDKLTDMEEYTYDQSSLGGVTEYQPFWQNYSDAIVTYLGNSVGGSDSKQYIISLYAFLNQFVTKNRGTQSTVDDSDAEAVFNIDGVVDDVLGYNIDYYDDYDSQSNSVPNLQNDTSRTQSAWSSDSGELDSLQTTYTDVLTDGAIIDIFRLDPVQQQGNWDGQIACDYIFDTLNWEWAADQGLITLTVPSRPT